MPRLVVEDFGVPGAARWELELRGVGEEDASSPSPAPAGDAAASSSPPAADASMMTVREAKARFTREVFGEAAPDAWVSGPVLGADSPRRRRARALVAPVVRPPSSSCRRRPQTLTPLIPPKT
jgi:hypothetical protein